jgi:hypothetical protein
MASWTDSFYSTTQNKGDTRHYVFKEHPYKNSRSYFQMYKRLYFAQMLEADMRVGPHVGGFFTRSCDNFLN